MILFSLPPLYRANKQGNGSGIYCLPISVNSPLFKKTKLLNKQRGMGLENSVDSKVLLCFFSAGTNITSSSFPTR